VGKSVLVVVDGDAWVHRAVAGGCPHTASGESIEIVPCTTARGALNACCALEPDCVLSELSLPGSGPESGPALDGLWLAAALREQPSRVATVPIVMASATDDEETRLAALRGGVDVFVGKPFQVVEVVAQIRALIAMTSRLRARDAARGGSVLPAEEVSGDKRAIVGDLDRMSVATVLSALELERRSGDVVLRSGRSGRLVMNLAGGVLVGGWLHGVAVSPLEAMRAALLWRGRRFEFRPSSERRVSSSAGNGNIGSLVLEALRLDEPAAFAEPLDPEPNEQRPSGRSGTRRRAVPGQPGPLPYPTAPGKRLVETVLAGRRPDPRAEPEERVGTDWKDEATTMKVRRFGR